MPIGPRVRDVGGTQAPLLVAGTPVAGLPVLSLRPLAVNDVPVASEPLQFSVP